MRDAVEHNNPRLRLNGIELAADRGVEWSCHLDWGPEGKYPARYLGCRANGQFAPFMRRECRHEAGHAVIAAALGLRVEFATLGWLGPPYHAFVRSSFPPDESGRRAAIIVAMAGSAVDGRDWRRTRSSRIRLDRAEALRVVAALTTTKAEQEVVLARLWRIARWVVRRHAAEIERVADALLLAETLSGDEIRALLTEHPA